MHYVIQYCKYAWINHNHRQIIIKLNEAISLRKLSKKKEDVNGESG